MIEEVVLVNENDEAIGLMEKQMAHEKGLLHRAVSVFIFNTKGEMLLQQRASTKYHSAGLWTNASCSHPKQNEQPLEAANRRLWEEMGLHCELKFLFSFKYNVLLSNQLIENEFDYVFVGTTDAEPILNKNEADDFRYITFENLKNELNIFPEKFTEWFKLCVNNVLADM